MPLRELGPLVRRIEDAGYDSVWSAEATEHDGFTPLVVAAEHSEAASTRDGNRERLHARAGAARADGGRAGGREQRPLRAGARRVVERDRRAVERHPVPAPLTKVAETVDYLRTVLAGERGSGGFKLASPPAQPVPIILAALRERMLQLAAEKADGVFANFLPLGNVEQVVSTFGRPDKEVACRFFSIHGPEEEALATAKRTFVAYATVPVYAEFFRWLGRGGEIEPVVEAWNAGDRKRALELAPEGLVREIFLLGPVEAQRERLAEFADAGIETAVLAVSCSPTELPDVIDAFGPRTG